MVARLVLGESDAREMMGADGCGALAGGRGPEQSRVEPRASALLGCDLAERGGDGEGRAAFVRVGGGRRGGGIDRCCRSQ